MITRKLVVAAIAATLPLTLMPVSASAQKKSEEQQWIDYQNCVTEYVARGMGNLSAAEAFCGFREFGDEGSGGGYSEHPPLPPGKPVQQCWGNDCNPIQ